MRKLFVIFLILFQSLFEFARAEDKVEELKKRIELLEQQQEEFLQFASDNTPQVNSFLRSNFTFGGFFEPSYTFMQGKNTPFQAASASNTLGLNFAAEFNPKLHFVGQFLTAFTYPVLNLQNDPRATQFDLPKHREFGTLFFGSILTQGYLDYAVNDELHLQGGQGYSPFGYAAQQRELVLFVRRGGPQLLRTTEFFSPLWSGIHLYQNLNLGKNKWGYSLYSFTRIEDAKLPGIGGRIWFNPNGENLLTGLSFQTAKFNGSIEEVLGYDIRFQASSFVLTAEYANHLTKNDNPWTFYIEPSVFIYREEVLLYTFIDFAQSTLNKTGVGPGALSDPYQKYEYGLGLNWLPTSYTRLRAGFTYNDYVHGSSTILGQDRDYYCLDISAGVAF